MMAPMILCGLLVIAGGSAVALVGLRRFPRWAWRREVQLFVLAAPSLGLVFGPMQDRDCGASDCIPQSMSLVGLNHLVYVAMAFMVVAALVLSVARAVLLTWLATRNTRPAGAGLEQRMLRLATALHSPVPRLLLRSCDRPLALTLGFRRPILLLSTWMVERLDRQELDAVLAHELAHIARRDYVVIWLATVLRDAFFYLPTSHAAYAQLQQEKEEACDDLALSLTRRPLGLASALAKVWHCAVSHHPYSVPKLGQALISPSEQIEGRIARLLDTDARAAAPEKNEHVVSLRISAFTVCSLLLAYAGVLVVALLAMGCGPVLAS